MCVGLLPSPESVLLPAGSMSQTSLVPTICQFPPPPTHGVYTDLGANKTVLIEWFTPQSCPGSS